MLSTFFKGDDNYVWLLKPINLNRGRYIFFIKLINRGIEIFNSL